MGVKKWLDRKSKSEKILLCCILILVFVVVVLFICFLTSNDNQVCTKPECLRAAVHILDTVDKEADPCDDFYAFACGNFMKMAMSKGQPTTLHKLNELTTNQLRQIIVEDRSNESNIPKSLAFQRKFYKSCINTRSIEEDENRTFLTLLDELMGGWPLIKMTNWIEENFSWISTMVKARKLGLYDDLFLTVEIYENGTNGKLLLWVTPPDDKRFVKFYFNDTNEDKMYDIVKYLGATSVDIMSDIRATSAFAENLRKMAENHNNKTLPYNSPNKRNITIGHIKHRLIKLDWPIFLREMSGLHVKESDHIVYDVDQYLTDLYYLLLKTPKRIQANYVAWIILSTNIEYLSKTIRDKYGEILKSYNVTSTKESRNDTCYNLCRKLFRTTAEAEYIRRYTTPFKKKQIQSMVDYIKLEMKKSIQASQWMDQISKTNALRQLKNITTAIGWMDIAFNVTKVEILTGFHKVKASPNDRPLAIDIARIVEKIDLDAVYQLVNLGMDELERMGIPKLEVNAYFDRYHNKLILPAPILQGQIFDINRPYYMNFGALGTVIGHELSHGFSIYYNLSGKTFDDGPKELWTNNTAAKRMEIAQCVDDEYNRFQIEHGRNKTNHTSGEENIADFNGVNVAYAAYQNWVRYNGREHSLPGIKFTPNQLYWIMASTYMCFEPKLSDKDRILGRNLEHALPEFRVIGRIRHSPYFAQDFNCPRGSRMNPVEKCRIYF